VMSRPPTGGRCSSLREERTHSGGLSTSQFDPESGAIATEETSKVCPVSVRALFRLGLAAVLSTLPDSAVRPSGVLRIRPAMTPTVRYEL
jgi:hypothetical protein